MLFFFPLLCAAQIPSEGRSIYTRKDGLSNNTVTSLVKDTRGFLWIGTSEGLNRFDGNHFANFFSDPKNDATLSGNNIFDIIQYQPGLLLIATNNGLSVLNTFTNAFENERILLPGVKRGVGVYMRSLFQDREGHIYVNHGGEIDVFTRDLRFMYRLTDTPWGRPLKGIIITFEHWAEDSKGRLWLPSDNFGICLLDEQTHEVYTASHNPLHYTFINGQPVRSFYYDEAEERVFFSSLGAGLQRHDIKTGKVITQDFNQSNTGEARTINAITRKNGRLICCGGHNLYSLDPETMQFENIYQNLNDPASPAFIDCFTVLNDLENIWIGTETKGLLQLPVRNSSIRQIPLPYTIHDYTGFSTGIARAASGLLYFAYGYEGLVEVDQVRSVARRYQFPAIGNKPLFVNRICRDSGDYLLVGTSAGFFLFNTVTKKIIRDARLPAFTDKLNVCYLLRDRKGGVWMSFRDPNALGYFEERTGAFHYYPGYMVGGKAVFDTNYVITRMNEDEDGRVWMISYQTAGKISCFDPSSNSWRSYPEKGRSGQVVEGKELNSICVGGKIMWVGNIYGLGLLRYDLTTDSLRRIGRKEGLLSDNILFISKDRGNNLFVATMAGINYLNTTTNEIRSLIADAGNADWAFAFIQYYDPVDNQLVYGLNDRIVIAGGSLWEAPVSDSLQTYIDDITVNNLPYSFDGSPLRLSHAQKNISIHFTSISYSKNVRLLYAYKMTGVDKDWNMSQQITTTNYSNLSPGKYVFQVRTKGPSGRWGAINDTVQIVILPAVWQTVWFWVVIALVVSLALIWLVRRRIRNIRGDAALKQKLVETEMMALRSQMNPHFIFNCLNAIDNLIQTNQADRATTYLTRFAKLIRSLLEYSKNNVIPFHKDIETLQLYLQLEQFRAGNKFLYELTVDDELVNGDYKVPPLIVQPFVENAIQHGLLNKQQGERKLSVNVVLEGKFIRYTIWDNGVGRVTAQEIKDRNKPEHKSFGIQITTERLELHNRNGKEKDIVITDLSDQGIANGTKVEIRIKID